MINDAREKKHLLSTEERMRSPSPEHWESIKRRIRFAVDLRAVGGVLVGVRGGVWVFARRDAPERGGEDFGLRGE